MSHVPAPHRRVADADGRRPGRRAPRPAAPGRRRLPRHDPHRVRPPRHLARHLRREPHGDRRRARRPARRRSPRCGRSWPTTTATGCSRSSSRPARPGPTCPSRVTSAGDLCEVRVPVPDRAGVLAEVTTLAGTLDVNIADLEIAHSSEGEQGVLILLVEAGAAERLRGRPRRPGLPTVGHPARVSGAAAGPDAGRPDRGARSTSSCRCPARRASPTGPWCARRWPTAPARSPAPCTPTTPRRWSTGSARSAPAIDADWAAGRLVVTGTAGRPDQRRGDRRRPAVGDHGPVPAAGRRRWARATGASMPPTGCGSDRWREVARRGARARRRGPRRRRAGAPAGRGRRRDPGRGRGGGPRRRLQPVPLRACCSPARPCAPGWSRGSSATLVSQPYVDMTVAVMARFGVDGRSARTTRTWVVAPAGLPGRRPRDRARRQRRRPTSSRRRPSLGGRVTRRRASATGSLQGDLAFVDVLEQMGATVERAADAAPTVTGTGPLRGVEVDLSQLSDTAQTLAVVAAFADGPDPGHRHRVHPRQGDRPRRQRGRRAAPARASTPTEEPDGFTVHPGPLRPATVADLRRPPHGDGLRPRSACGSDGVADRRSRVRGQDVPRATGGSSTSCERRRRRGAMVRTAMRVIAIDGPAGSGKSTVAKALAARLGLEYLDTGAMYRSVTFAALRRGIDPAEAEQVGPHRGGHRARGPRRRRHRRRRRRHDRDPRPGGEPGGEHRGGQPRRARRDGAAAAGVGRPPATAACSRAATSAPWCSPTPSSRCTSPPIPRCGPSAARRRSPTSTTRRSPPTWPGATPSTRAGRSRRSRRPHDAFLLDTTGMTVEEIVDTIAGEARPRERSMADDRPGDDVEIWTGPPSRGTRISYAIVRGLILGGGQARSAGSTVVGAEKIPADGAYILAPVHRSNVDFALTVDRHPPADALHGQGQHLEVEAARSVRVDARCVPRAPRHAPTAMRCKACTDIVERWQPARDVPRGHPPERAGRAGDVRRHRLRGGQGRRADHPDGHRRHRGDDAQGRQAAPPHQARAGRRRPDPAARRAPRRAARRAARSRSSPSGSTARSRTLFDDAQARAGRPNPPALDRCRDVRSGVRARIGIELRPTRTPGGRAPRSARGGACRSRGRRPSGPTRRRTARRASTRRR